MSLNSPRDARFESECKVMTDKRHILLVDDDQAVSDSARLLLEIEGYSVTTSSRGAHAIEAFRDAQTRGNPFDLVITDLRMPEVDGYAVAAAVKQTAPATPVMLMTGMGEQPSQRPEHQSVIDVTLGKPTRLADLRAALGRCFGKTQH